MLNVEAATIAWLSALSGYESWPVFGDMPQAKPDSFILVDRTGGAREAMVLDRADILIEVYHKQSRMAASDKANEIADAVPGLVATADDITHASVNSVVNLPDTLASYHRYQVYCDIYCRR